MPRLSQRAGKNRLAVFAGIAAVIGAAWLLLGRGGVELLHEERITATVKEVLIGGAAENQNAPQGVGIVVVELPDGGRARVFAPLRNTTVGGLLMVTVKRYSDGGRVVTAAGPAERPVQRTP